MYKEAKYITTIPGDDKRTAYFLCKNPRVLVPMELRDNSNFVRPDICTVLHQIITALRAEVISSKIYKFQDSAFYTYLTLKQKGKYMDINIPPVIAIKICRFFDTPILINERIINDVGFCVTKEMIENALSSCPQNY